MTKKLFAMSVIMITTCLSYGQQYNSVTIGSQTWMTENLNVSKFRNGEEIPQAKSESEWQAAWNNKKPAWCYYNNDPSNGEKYGKLYNGYAVMDPRGLAPQGWHIPSEAEWTELSKYLNIDWGIKLKSTNGWENNGNGNNSSGFTALPGGWRHYKAAFDYQGMYGQWWSSTESDGNWLWTRYLSAKSDQMFRGAPEGKDRGMSVRCVKD